MLYNKKNLKGVKMLQDFWEFTSKFITIEELQATAILSVISIIIIGSLWWGDRYEKKLKKESEKK